jgi:hypothetical protein
VNEWCVNTQSGHGFDSRQLHFFHLVNIYSLRSLFGLHLQTYPYGDLSPLRQVGDGYSPDRLEGAKSRQRLKRSGYRYG